VELYFFKGGFLSSCQYTGWSCCIPGLRSWKSRSNWTQNSHLKCIPWGLRDWQPHSYYIQCITIPLMDKLAC